MNRFPELRLRRLRRSQAMRQLVQETRIDVRDLVYPLFVVEGSNLKQEIASMPGINRFSVDRLPQEIAEITGLGIPAVILFGIPRHKDEAASGAYAKDGVVQQAVRAIKKQSPELIVITDVCLCEYTSHGHCGILKGETVDNDKTLPLLARTALSHAAAGADIVAPSDMMDGRVAAIRQALDGAEFEDIPILSYAAKYASAFFGPFREAAESAPQHGDRRSYQMDPPNWRQARREVDQDIAEGADMVMVKPALAYLDIICRVRQSTDLPLAAYNVSGEYAMVKAATAAGSTEEKRLIMEILTAIKRAGADIIISYHAKEMARWLKEGEL